MALHEPALPDSYFEPYLIEIETGIHQQKNRVREAMNNALIAIGVRNAALQEKALSAAQAIGPVEIDHGETNCKTPDAAEYILRTGGASAEQGAQGESDGRTRGTGSGTRQITRQSCWNCWPTFRLTSKFIRAGRCASFTRISPAGTMSVTTALREHAAGRIPATPVVNGINAYNAESVHTRETLDYEHIVEEWHLARAELQAALRNFPLERLHEPLVFPWGPTGSVRAVGRSSSSSTKAKSTPSNCAPGKPRQA